MHGEALLIAMAQLAITTAGFAGIVGALSRGKWTAGHRLRLNGLVTASLSAAILSLLPLLVFAMTPDERTAVVVASALASVYFAAVLFVRIRQMARVRLLSRRIGVFSMVSLLVLLASAIANTVSWASLGVFAAALALELFTAFVLFYSLLSLMPAEGSE